MQYTNIVEAEQCERFIRYAKPGEWFRYHIGCLAKDRTYAWKTGSPCHDIATRIWSLYERGLVDLMQSRIGEGTYEYFAQRKPKPKSRFMGPIE